MAARMNREGLMFRSVLVGSLVALLGACSNGEADLVLKLVGDDVVAVGETVDVVVVGPVLARKNTYVKTRVSFQAPDLDYEAVDFEWRNTVPGDSAAIVPTRIPNWSEDAYARLMGGRGSEIKVRYRVTCLEPASGELVASWSLETNNRHPMMEGGSTEGTPFECVE